MMKRIRTIIFPNICVSFTLVMVFLCGMALLFDGKIRNVEHFVVELFAVLWVISFICMLLGELKWKRAFLYPLLELCVNYAVFLFAAYIFGWMSFELPYIIVDLIIITVFYMNIYFRTKRQIAREAGQINRLIRERS